MSQVVFLAADDAFPENGSKSTLYVKLCWDTMAFRPVESEWVQPGPKPVAPQPAPVTRSLPTPDVAVMKRACSVSLRQLSRSVGKVGAGEAESSHSASKLSASKALSHKRRGSCEATPGVRKKLDLSSECSAPLFHIQAIFNILYADCSCCVFILKLIIRLKTHFIFS